MRRSGPSGAAWTWGDVVGSDANSGLAWSGRGRCLNGGRSAVALQTRAVRDRQVMDRGPLWGGTVWGQPSASRGKSGSQFGRSPSRSSRAVTMTGSPAHVQRRAPSLENKRAPPSGGGGGAGGGGPT